jgi:hypothetical protein
MLKETKKKQSSSSSNSEDDKKDEIDLSNTENKFINKKRKNNTYALDDKELKLIHINDDIKARLIANDNGYFVDIRKYYKGYPTKRGIRILATKFNTLADILKADIEEIFDKK